ncbi:MAG TPA: DUF5662 family protein [Jeotgalicoccus sp.]|nr:DUF5662 family protein [Jeotgalicoccus sp.]
MEYTKEDCIKDTKKHIKKVQDNLAIITKELTERGKIHDASKLESPELEIFTEYTPKLAVSTYGSQEYIDNTKGMRVALDHHYANNSHHPQYYPNGIKGMDLLDIIEMFCDWKAATERHEDGDINKSININQERFDYSDDLKEIFKNTVKYF